MRRIVLNEDLPKSFIKIFRRPLIKADYIHVNALKVFHLTSSHCTQSSSGGSEEYLSSGFTLTQLYITSISSKELKNTTQIVQLKILLKLFN